MKNQSYRKGWAFVLTLVLAFTTMFGGFGFLGINGMVGEVYAVAPGATSTSQTWDTNGTVNAITIDGAATVITINPGVTVTVNDTITIDGNVTITGGGILLRGSGVTGNMILVNSGKTLTINGVTIDGDNQGSGYADSPLIANNGGTLNINDGAVIENNKSRGIWNGGATAILNMTGGIIQNCSLTTVSTAGGGGVANVWGATFNMTGGLIKNCSSNWHGGGVYNSDSSIFIMSDGIIEYCSVTNTGTYAQGGGIDNANNSNFTMSGGTIQNCSAIANSGRAYGGGVSNYSSTFTMSGGTIKDCNATGINSADTYGGGIFQLGNLYISGAPVIKDNTIMGSISNNIDLYSNTRVVTVNSAMINATKIGVYAHNPSDSPTVLTGTAIDADTLNRFSSENSGYILSYSTPGSIQMIVPPTYALTIAGGGASSTTGSTNTAGTNISINAGTKANYTFNGWTSNAGGTFADAADVSTTFTMPASAVTITANWTAKTAVAITETAQTFVYDGAAKAFAITGTPNTGFTITYNQGAGNVIPVNAGNYNVEMTRAEDGTYASYSRTIADGLVISNGAQTAPTVGKTDETMDGNNDGTITGVTTLMEYKLNGAGGYTAIAANPVSGLAPGTYLVRYKAKTNYNAGTDASVTIAAGAVTYTMSASTLTAFASQTVGYTTPPAIQTVTLSNTGSSTITLTQPTSTNYTIGMLSTTTLAVSGTATFTVQPKTGLAVGAYSENIAVTGTSGAAASVSAQFNVTAAGGGGGGGGSTPVTSIINTNTGSVTGNQLKNAADAAKDGGTVTIKSNETSEVTLPNSGLGSLAGKNNSLTVVTENGTLTFDSKAVGAIGTQAAATDIKVIVDDIVKTTLTEEQQTKVGDKTVYDLSVMSGGKLISSFNGGKVSVSIPYELKTGETAENLTVWYMADNGSLTEINCTYDAKNKAVTFVVDHFSKYIIGQDELADWVNSFTDVKSSAWYYDAVAFVNTNGLMKGQTDTVFGPQTSMTRGMFVTILGRMEGIDATLYASKNTFSDVKSNQYYAPYIAWANEKGIVTGMGGDKFAPNTAVTREQMAVMMTNYLKFKGQGPAGAWAIQLTYGDLDKVSSWADEAVMFMTAKDLMNGMGNDAKGNPMFAPKATSTRAQTAQVMMSLGELVN